MQRQIYRRADKRRQTKDGRQKTAGKRQQTKDSRRTDRHTDAYRHKDTEHTDIIPTNTDGQGKHHYRDPGQSTTARQHDSTTEHDRARQSTTQHKTQQNTKHNRAQQCWRSTKYARPQQQRPTGQMGGWRITPLATYPSQHPSLAASRGSAAAAAAARSSNQHLQTAAATRARTWDGQDEEASSKRRQQRHLRRISYGVEDREVLGEAEGEDQHQRWRPELAEM